MSFFIPIHRDEESLNRPKPTFAPKAMDPCEQNEILRHPDESRVRDKPGFLRMTSGHFERGVCHSSSRCDIGTKNLSTLVQALQWL